MKKHNISQFLKSKGFYVVLIVAVVAIAAVTVVGLNMRSKGSKQENLVDLNTPAEVAENERTDIEGDLLDAVNNTDAAANESNHSKEETVIGDYTNDDLLEFDVGSYTVEDNTNETAEKEESNTEVASVPENEQSNETAVSEQEEPEQSVSVMQPKVTLDSLQFSEESVLGWPVKGNVIMPFSSDNLVHYATLGEWKTNPAIVISSEVGSDVLSAAKGIVSSIEKNDETGTTVKVGIGSGYEVVYGQLSDVTCAVGDVVSEGTVIGKIAEPTKYYVVEGSNLYLQVLNNGTPVNPMLYLAGEE